MDQIAAAIGVDVDALVGQIDQDVVVNKRKVIEAFDVISEDSENIWKLIKYCYSHASQEDKNKVLTILKVREKWNEYKEMENLFTE